MNKTYKLSALWMMCLMLFGCLSFSACDNGDDEDTNQYKGGVNLNVFGPCPVARGGELRFLGSGMNKVTAVVIPGSGEVTDIKVISDTEIRVMVPQTAKPGLLVLKTPQGDITTKTPITFTEPISLDEVSPASVKPGDVITIKGEYLNLIKEVIFADNAVVTEFEGQSREELKVTVPVKAKTGKIIISDGAEIPNWIYSELVLEVAVPTFKSIAPATVKVGKELTISGENLNWVSSVKFDGAEATELTVSKDAKTLTVTVPEKVKTGDVALVCHSGVEVPAGKIETVKPTNLVVAPSVVKNGTVFKITGKDMDLVKSVLFPNVADAVTPQEGSDATMLSLLLPEKAQDGDITLNMANGETVTVAYTTVKPTISAFMPAALVSGQKVTITGTALDLVTTVVFEGEGTPSVTLEKGNHLSDTKIELIVPVVATTCAPKLILINGIEVKTTVVLDITPATDPAVAIMPARAMPGDVITLEGKNLNTVETFYISGVKVTKFAERSATKVVLTVPMDAPMISSTIKMVNYEGKEFFSANKIQITGQEEILSTDIIMADWDKHGSHDGSWDGSWSGIASVGSDGTNSYLQVTSDEAGWKWLINCNHQGSIVATWPWTAPDASKYVVKYDILVPAGKKIPETMTVVLYLGKAPGTVEDVKNFFTVKETNGKWITVTVDLNLSGAVDVSGENMGLALKDNALPIGTCIDNFRLSLK